MVKRIIILLFVFSSILSFGQANRFAGFGSRSTIGCPSTNYLADAQRFIDSSGITDVTEIAAVKQLVKDLQDSCLWTKMKAVYPFVGSSASSTKWNLKNPLNADTAFRITWNGGMSYGYYGIQGNGSNAYGNPYFYPTTNFTAFNDLSFSIYLGLNLDTIQSPLGCINASYRGYSVFPRTSNTFYSNSGETLGTTSATSTDSRGIYIVNRKAPSTSETLKNGVFLMTNGGVNDFPTLPYPIVISARTLNGTLEYYSTNKIGWVGFHDGLTHNESVTLNNIIQRFLTALSR